MTAEIAILNRTAIALAADSAVTIGRGESAKTYLSENKLFEISEKKPIGLMLYNALDFYGVPWEVLIKDFRQEHGNNACNEVTDWKNIFIEYITHGSCPSDDAQLNQFLYRSRLTLSSLMNEFFDYLRKLSPPSRRKKQNEQFSFEEAFTGLVEQKITFARKKRVCEGFGDGEFIRGFIQKNKDALDDMAKHTFPFPLNGSMSSKLTDLYFEHWYREVPSDSCTGFVFAGFGDSQKFPALEHILFDGVIGGKLRYFHIDAYAVDSTGSIGTVLAFAQQDMAHRFLYGIDDVLERTISTYFTDAINNLTVALTARLRLGGKRGSELKAALEEYSDAVKDEYFNEASGKLKSEYFASVEDMVRLMPKQEMAHLAEALVNITSIKRKASSEQETVGGPIDVAVISRHEGFVWVKRKHYFNADLNPRYFWRRFERSAPITRKADEHD